MSSTVDRRKRAFISTIHRFNLLIHLFCILALPLPFYVTFTAGAIAGVSEILTFYPLGALAPL